MSARIFASADELQDWMHACNENGLDPVTAVLDAGGMVWMTFGEERSHGGEAMECWLTYGDPSDDNRSGVRPCDECGGPTDERGFRDDGSVALDKARYPLTLLHDLLEAHWSQRCRCGHRLDHHVSQFSHGEGVCKPKGLSEVFEYSGNDECVCTGFPAAS